MVKSPDAKSKRLKLSHHTHTGKKLHKSHTSYPLIAVLLLMVGMLLTAMTLQVKAADVTVTAVVNGTTPVVPAVILSPENDDRFTDSQVPVSGTCDPGYVIKLFRNEIFSGATICTAGGTFAITTDLFAGQNDLQARTYNIADNEGPGSAIVTVYYDVPVDPIDPTEPDEPGQPSQPNPPGSYQPGGTPDGQAPFYLSTEYFFKAAYSGQKIKWDFDILGGNAPFAAHVVWGDGYSDTIPQIDGAKVSIEHAYQTLKETREYFTVTIRVQDEQGRRASLQLIAIMNDPNVISGALVRPDNGGPASAASIFNGMLKFVWSAYGILILMGICFWLGERRGESVTKAWYRRRRNRTA